MVGGARRSLTQFKCRDDRFGTGCANDGIGSGNARRLPAHWSRTWSERINSRRATALLRDHHIAVVGARHRTPTFRGFLVASPTGHLTRLYRSRRTAAGAEV